jgi:signal transduction histidine kinase
MERYIRPACIVLIAAAFAVDLVTPQLFVAAILLNAPIALSSLALDRRFTQVLIVVALVANAIAGYANGVMAGYRWDALAIGDRIISGLSFLLVGVLSIASQSAAKRAGELEEREDRARRERVVSRAIEAVRASMNTELIERAIAREACAAFDAGSAWMFAFAPSATLPTTYRAQAEHFEVEVLSERPAGEILSLLERMSARRDPLHIDAEDAFSRLVLDTLGIRAAIAVTIVDQDTVFGVLIAGRNGRPFDRSVDEVLRLYAQQSAISLTRATLFAQLGARNDELARANAALTERSEVIRDIVLALSHDLRTPLAASGMTMRQALSGAFGPLPPQYTEILRRTIASNDELQRLAETLLLVARYESGDRSQRREPVDVLMSAKGVVAELEPLWRDKGIAVSVDGDGTSTVLADPLELRRALVNLIANAIRFTPAGGAVAIRANERNGRATIDVEDNGYGVPERERGRLFERLQDVDARAGAGSGLGLYIVKLIAESHGGEVRYRPGAEGGSVFSLVLPVASGITKT